MGLTEGLSNHLARSLLSLNVFECGTEEEKIKDVAENHHDKMH